MSGRPAISQARVIDLGGQRLVLISGQTGRTPEGELTDGDLEAHVRAVYANLDAVMRAAGGSLAGILSLRTYLTHEWDVPAFQALRDQLNREIWGDGPYPTSTLLVVAALARPEFRVEIEATGLVPLK